MTIYHSELVRGAEIMLGAAQGKTIECRLKEYPVPKLDRYCICDHTDWSFCCTQPPQFNFGMFEYRIQPK